MQKKKTTMCSRLLLQYYRTEDVYETCALRKGGGGKCLSIHYCIHNYLHGRTHKKKRKKKIIPETDGALEYFSVLNLHQTVFH